VLLLPDGGRGLEGHADDDRLAVADPALHPTGYFSTSRKRQESRQFHRHDHNMSVLQVKSLQPAEERCFRTLPSSSEPAFPPP
jgi:hypothetical protein